MSPGKPHQSILLLGSQQATPSTSWKEEQPMAISSLRYEVEAEGQYPHPLPYPITLSPMSTGHVFLASICQHSH